MFFLIFSMSRCGSTSLCRAFAEAASRKLSYEPWFGESWQSRSTLHAFLDGLRTDTIGLKHVWDPNGSPFGNIEHLSTFDNLRQADRWVDVNRQLLDYPWDRIIFLHRRNQLERTLSDFIGQQTNLWGHNPKGRHSPRERESYRAKLAMHDLAPVDLELLAWYLEHASRLESRLVDSVQGRPHKVVHYEDLFGADVGLEDRLLRFGRLCEWLGLEAGPLPPAVAQVLSPSSKYNDDSILARIPNLADARALAARIARSA